MSNKKFIELLKKYQEGLLPGKFTVLLDQWMGKNTPEADTTVWPAKDEENLKTQIVSSLLSNEPVINSQRKRELSWFRWAGIAAGILLLVSVSTFWVLTSNKKTEEAFVIKETTGDIMGGENKAILTLANGEMVVLDNSENGFLTEQGQSNIIKESDGKVSYTRNNKKTKDLIYNVLTTPKGGQYHLILADGSNVWLNAASSITYPTNFSNTDRMVKIEGEVYFEIAESFDKHHKKIPFRVKANQMEISVLGTEFNVCAYSDESEIVTTLLEGSVKILTENQATILKPGDQASVAHNAISIASNSNIDEAIAWKNGLFLFNDAPLEEVMRQVTKWYDVEVDFKDTSITTVQLSGIVSRELPLAKMLEILKLSGVDYKLEGKKIIII